MVKKVARSDPAREVRFKGQEAPNEGGKWLPKQKYVFDKLVRINSSETKRFQARLLEIPICAER